MIEVGETVHEELKRIRGSYYLERNIVKQYRKKIDEKTNCLDTPLVHAPFKINYLFENSIVTPSVISEIAYNKFIFCVPLYRQEKDLKAQGINISRQTMSHWLNNTAEFYLMPVYEELLKELRTQEVIHMDETTIDVIETKKERQKCYVWIAASGKYEKNQIKFYGYYTSREYKIVSVILGDDYAGNIHSDGYGAYQNQKFLNITCMAHVRRRFFEAYQCHPKSKQFERLQTADEQKEFLNEYPSLKDVVYILELIKQMFHIDTKYEVLEDRREVKEKYVRPLMDKFFACLEEISYSYAKKNKMSVAINYALDNKERIYNYLKDPRFELSNNRAERDVKSFVMARKNFLFSYSEQGAKCNSIYMTLMQTARANGLDPYEYLEYVLTRFKDEGMTDEIIQQVLPYSERAQQDLRNTKFIQTSDK